MLMALSGMTRVRYAIEANQQDLVTDPLRHIVSGVANIEDATCSPTDLAFTHAIGTIDVEEQPMSYNPSQVTICPWFLQWQHKQRYNVSTASSGESIEADRYSNRHGLRLRKARQRPMPCLMVLASWLKKSGRAGLKSTRSGFST